MSRGKSHWGDKTYIVRQFYVVEVELKAANKAEARDLALDDDYEYDVTTHFISQPGGPAIFPDDYRDTEVIELDGGDA
jgi:hypothetical protein